MYELIADNFIKIAGREIKFPKETVIKNIQAFKNGICFFTWPLEKDLDWNRTETHELWNSRCKNNPRELYCYSQLGELLWKFESANVTGYGLVIPNEKKVSDFVSEKHYEEYISKFSGKELLEVYAGDFRFLLDANTGEIYDKIVSR